MDLLTTDKWALWPPTPVILTTLSMEAAPGIVSVMECGVGHLQCVSVSKMDFELFLLLLLIPYRDNDMF